LRVSTQDDRWQIALVGRNLTNKFIYSASYDVPFTGTAPTGLPTGDAGAVLADRAASVSRGRELLFQFSRRFDGI
jgi:iron complex outermembrane receptor protein